MEKTIGLAIVSLVILGLFIYAVVNYIKSTNNNYNSKSK